MKVLNENQYLDKTFNQLTVISSSRRELKGSQIRTVVDCKCICGSIFTTTINRILTGHTKSCGCVRVARRTHFQTTHPLYRIWSAMKRRCTVEKDAAYKNYGGRGIKVCDEWTNSFAVFFDWAINNGWQESLEIDREHNDEDYNPTNCRFVTSSQNCRNRRSTIFINIEGRKIVLAEAIEKGLIDKWKYYRNENYRNTFSQISA